MGSSREDRFDRLAQAGRKIEVSESPKEAFPALVGMLLHSCRIVQRSYENYVCLNDLEPATLLLESSGGYLGASWALLSGASSFSEG